MLFRESGRKIAVYTDTQRARQLRKIGNHKPVSPYSAGISRGNGRKYQGREEKK